MSRSSLAHLATNKSRIGEKDLEGEIRRCGMRVCLIWSNVFQSTSNFDSKRKFEEPQEAVERAVLNVLGRDGNCRACRAGLRAPDDALQSDHVLVRELRESHSFSQELSSALLGQVASQRLQGHPFARVARTMGPRL